MSVRGLIEVAAQRDQGVPMKLESKAAPAAAATAAPAVPLVAPVAGAPPAAPAPAAAGADAGADNEEPKGYLDMLVTAIPTEPLALYTFLVAGIVTTIEPGTDQRLIMRWIIFAATAVFIAIWMIGAYLRSQADQKRRGPWVEMLCAVIAFCAWGLVMPESPLLAELSGTDQTVWTFIITAAGAALVGLLAGSMKKPAKPNA